MEREYTKVEWSAIVKYFDRETEVVPVRVNIPFQDKVLEHYAFVELLTKPNNGMLKVMFSHNIN